VTGGAVGSSAYAHRADARAALGQIDDAIADLEKSIELSPTRLGARVALASLLDRRGDDARARALFDQLVDEAPGLLSDAARDEGIVLWKTRRPSPTADDRKRVLGRALTLLGGNRSASRVTYRTSGGVLRTVPTPVGERPHLGGDEHDLAHIKRLLCRASGVSSRAGPSRLEPVLARTDSEVELVDLVDPVDPVDVETFVSRGCVRVRGAFSQEIAKRWVARAAARIREDPRRWVRGYDESDPERALDAFDPDDQGTWTWERLDLSATEELPLERVAPRAFDLAATLVGGAARFERALVSDHLSVNFHNQSDPKRIAPTLGDGSWHLDDPARDDRLTTFRRGLIVFIVLSDLRPRSGAPFIAPESVARVARELAAHPETGVDFVARDVSMRISAECTERVELEGELGDVFLIHPMMLHSSSGNPSGRIRWMANPILTLKEPLRLDGDDPSPLERSVLIALGTGQK
jgi:tetratricopeptide (TPR) repeat protein